MKLIQAIVIVVVVTLAGLVAFAYSGLYNIAAGTGHTAVTGWFLTTVRHRSIAARADALTVPDNLDQEERIRAGAGHYADTCAGCHGRPGKEPASAFDPPPPALYRNTPSPAKAFWVVKHGIKMSAMPRHSDHSGKELWDIVAFLQQLPSMTPAEYKELASSTEHSHDSEEAHDGEEDHGDGHSHDGGDTHDHEASAADRDIAETG